MTKSERTSPAPTREDLYRRMVELYRPYMSTFPGTDFRELLMDRYIVSETRLMTLAQVEDLVRFMDDRLKRVLP